MAGARAAQRERTREALVAAARAQFAEHGFAAVGLGDVVADAGVTKGALYHHFPEGKDALFDAVVERAAADVAAAVTAAASTSSDPRVALRLGCSAFLDRATAPDVARVLLVHGPAVVGPQRWRVIDDEASGRLLAEGLEALVGAGAIAPRPVAPLARLLSGAMNEAAIWLTRNPDQRDRVHAELDALLASLA